jgi:hypothetical protein
MGVDPFQSPKRRLGRAKQHVRALDTGLQRFYKKQPYVRVIETHTDGMSQALKIKLRRQIPDRYTDIAYEALEALRSALDQTAYAAAVCCNHTRPDLVHFPVTDDPAQFENTVRGRCKDLPPEIVTLFRSFHAYPGGNDLLVALNRIRRQGFHRILEPVGSGFLAATGVQGTIKAGPIAEYPTYVPNMVWDSEKDEMIYGVVGPGGEFKYEIQFTFTVTFGEVEGLAGAPVVPALRELVRLVEGIILATESEARRIGLL